MAVAAIPLAAGITGDSYRDPMSFKESFMMAMVISAVLAVAGAVLAWLTLGERTSRRTTPEAVTTHRHCALESPPLSNSPAKTR
jgi:hypothetical protein